MDKLNEIFKLQAALDEKIIKEHRLDGLSQEEWIQKEILAMISELAEVLDEVNYKWWKNPRPVNQARLQEELVDVCHFLISMCLKSGMTADDLYQGYLQKNQENILRQEGKSTRSGYQPQERE